MRVNSADHAESDEDFIYYINNLTINNITREEESDDDNGKVMKYIKHKISTLEDSFIRVKKIKKDKSSLDFSTKDREFLVDFVKSLFQELNDINESCSKLLRKNSNKTEKLRKLVCIHKELYEKYSQMKINYKSILEQSEYKDRQISDLENLIKACDLEIFSLQSRINEITNFFQLNNKSKGKSKSISKNVSSWAFSEEADSTLKKIINDFEEKKSLLDDINSQLKKEKEELLIIVENKRNNLTKKENLISELKQEIEMKNLKINELHETIDGLETDVNRWKIKLDSEKKTNRENSDKLKYLTESIRRKKATDIQEKSLIEGEENLADDTLKAKRKYIKKRYKSCINLDEIVENQEEGDNHRDFSCRKRITFAHMYC